MANEPEQQTASEYVPVGDIAGSLGDANNPVTVSFFDPAGAVQFARTLLKLARPVEKGDGDGLISVRLFPAENEKEKDSLLISAAWTKSEPKAAKAGK